MAQRIETEQESISFKYSLHIPCPFHTFTFFPVVRVATVKYKLDLSAPNGRVSKIELQPVKHK